MRVKKLLDKDEDRAPHKYQEAPVFNVECLCEGKRFSDGSVLFVLLQVEKYVQENPFAKGLELSSEARGACRDADVLTLTDVDVSCDAAATSSQRSVKRLHATWEVVTRHSQQTTDSINKLKCLLESSEMETKGSYGNRWLVTAHWRCSFLLSKSLSIVSACV